MREIVAALLIASTATLASAQVFQHIPDPYKGTFVFEDDGYCTGFNSRKVGKKVWGYTAYHCLHGAQPGLTIYWASNPATGRHLGRVSLVCQANDVAMISYETEEDVEVLEVKMDPPPRGAVIWYVGMSEWDKDAGQPWLPFVSWGVWIGTPMKWKSKRSGVVSTAHQASLPVMKGMSGGPISHEGKVFGMGAVTIDDVLAAPWTGVALLNNLKLGCPNE